MSIWIRSRGSATAIVGGAKMKVERIDDKQKMLMEALVRVIEKIITKRLDQIKRVLIDPWVESMKADAYKIPWIKELYNQAETLETDDSKSTAAKYVYMAADQAVNRIVNDKRENHVWTKETTRLNALEPFTLVRLAAPENRKEALAFLEGLIAAINGEVISEESLPHLKIDSDILAALDYKV